MKMMVKKKWMYSSEILLNNTWGGKFSFASGTDKTFRLNDKNGKFYIGKKEAKIKENNIIVVDWEYVGTSGNGSL